MIMAITVLITKLDRLLAAQKLVDKHESVFFCSVAKATRDFVRMVCRANQRGANQSNERGK